MPYGVNRQNNTMKGIPFWGTTWSWSAGGLADELRVHYYHNHYYDIPHDEKKRLSILANILS